MKTAAIYTNILFSQFSQHVQISCLKNQHAKNQIVCLTASFTIAIGNDKVKVSHKKNLNAFFHSIKIFLQSHIITQ